MKTRELLYKLFYVISILLMVGFCIRLGVDWFKYDATLNSAPFYAFIIIRAITFLVPSAITFVVAKILHKKSK